MRGLWTFVWPNFEGYFPIIIVYGDQWKEFANAHAVIKFICNDQNSDFFYKIVQVQYVFLSVNQSKHTLQIKIVFSALKILELM